MKYNLVQDRDYLKTSFPRGMKYRQRLRLDALTCIDKKKGTLAGNH